MAPYYFGGFSHGANTSDTEGVHSADLSYKQVASKANGANGTNGVSA